MSKQSQEKSADPEARQEQGESQAELVAKALEGLTAIQELYGIKPLPKSLFEKREDPDNIASLIRDRHLGGPGSDLAEVYSREWLRVSDIIERDLRRKAIAIQIQEIAKPTQAD